MTEANYTKPASQLDLEARQADDYEVPSKLTQGTEPELSKNGYVGVDPIYQNHANSTEGPIEADGDNPEIKVFDEVAYHEDIDFSATDAPESNSDAAVEGEEDEDSDTGLPAGQQAPSGGTTSTSSNQS